MQTGRNNGRWDLSRSIRDYEFTRRAETNLKRITNVSEFRDRDAEAILLYLRDQMEIVSFGDHLKRFIYEKTGMTEPFAEIPEKTYQIWIADSFERNRAPHVFLPVQSRWSGILHRWLTCGSVERDTVFLVAFGLGMTDEEVSLFLMKVIKEHDFDFSDPRETVFWHCFHHGLAEILRKACACYPEKRYRGAVTEILLPAAGLSCSYKNGSVCTFEITQRWIPFLI